MSSSSSTNSLLRDVLQLDRGSLSPPPILKREKKRSSSPQEKSLPLPISPTITRSKKLTSSPVIVIERQHNISRAKFKQQVHFFLRGKIKSLCRGNLRAAYVNEEITRNADVVFVTLTDWGEAINFAVCQKWGLTVKLHVLCSQKGGADLLKYIIEWARRLKFEKIQLAALPHAINFYRKSGFKSSRTCEEEPVLQKIEVDALMRDENGNLKKFKPSDSLRDPKLVTYLWHLIARGLGAEPGCRDPRACNESGYIMTLCL